MKYLAHTYESSHSLRNYCLIDEGNKDIIFDRDRPLAKGEECLSDAVNFGERCKRDSFVLTGEIVANLPSKFKDGLFSFFPVGEETLEAFKEGFSKH